MQPAQMGTYREKNAHQEKCYQDTRKMLSNGWFSASVSALHGKKNTAHRLNRKSPVLPYISLGKHLSPSFISRA